MSDAKTYLAGKVTWLEDSSKNRALGKECGAGRCCFADAASPVTTAKFSAPGDYVLALES